jgi:uncharacterized protein YecT (DUF1311 family)
MKTVKMLAIVPVFFVCSIEIAMAASPKTTKLAIKTTSQVIKEYAPKGITNAFYMCVDKPLSNSARLLCIDDERERQDKRLNTAYKALLRKLSGDAKQMLIKSERGWLAFHEGSSAVEDLIYEQDYASRDVEMLTNTIFRLCERANMLEKYLGLMEIQ